MSTPVDPPEWLTLGAGEDLQYTVSPSSNLLLASLGIGVVLLIVMSVGVGFVADLGTGRTVSFATLVVIVALLVGAYGLTETREYVVTTNRAVVARGLRAKRTASVDLEAVADVEVVQTGWHRLLDVGTVQLHTAGGTTLTFDLVENPDAVGRFVRQSVAVDGAAPTPA